MAARHGLGTYGNAVGTVTPDDHKLAQAGLIVKDTTGRIRPGLFWEGNLTIVSGKANMSYDVARFNAALTRGATSGAVLLANDGVVNVTTTAAPGSNSRYDVVYVWQREYSLDGTNSDPVIGVVQGTAAASPTVPALTAFPGAIELARILIPAGVTATNSGTTITQTAPFTAAAGGSVHFPSTTAMNLVTNLPTGTLGEIAGSFYTFDGSAWIALNRMVGAILSRNATVFSTATGASVLVTNTYVDTTKAVGLTVSGGAITIITPGDYWVAGQAQFATNGTGIRQLQINRNSLTAATNLLAQGIVTPTAAGPTTVGARRLVTLAAGDVLRLFVAQNSGGALAVENAANTLAATYFEVAWAGA